MKDKVVETRAFFYLEDAEQRMNKARLAVINEIDRPERDDREYRALLIDLDQSIESYVGMVHKRLNGLYWRTSEVRGSETQSQSARRKQFPQSDKSRGAGRSTETI